MDIDAADASTTTGLDITPHPTHFGVFVVRDGDTVIGHVVQRGRLFRAARQHAEPSVDIRRVGDGFRSLTAAVRFIGKGKAVGFSG